MRAFPPALACAHALLGLLPPELAAALEALVVRAGRALGPFPAAQQRGREEPDGYAGISREPQYERLLLSEWLLADEAPDEFLRRASVGEHAFLALSRTSPQASRRCDVWIDAGPSVLGLPRIAILALLVALSRRALSAGAEFSWGVLGDQVRHSGLGTDGEVRAFLDARTTREPEEDDFALPAGEADERWVLGSPRALAHAPAQAHRVMLEEPWDGKSVHLTLVAPSRAPRTLTLPMPDDALCVRLLRDPFAKAPKAVRGEESLSDEAFFTGRGHRLVEYRKGEVRALSVPTNINMPPGRMRVFKPDESERVLACTYVDRLIVVTVSAEHVHLHGLASAHAPSGSLTIPFANAGTLSPRSMVNPCLFLAGKQQFVALVPLKQGMLLAGKRDQPSAHFVNERYVAGVQSGRPGQALWLRARGTHMELAAQQPRLADWQVLAQFESEASRAYFAYPRDRPDCYSAYVAVLEGERMRVAGIRPPGQRLEFRDLFVPQGMTCLGIAHMTGWAEVQMIALDSDKKSVVALGRSGAHPVVRSEQPVDYAELCPHSSVVVLGTPHELTLFDLRTRRALWVAKRAQEEH